MKKLITLTILAFSIVCSVKGQNSNAVFFSENGEQFSVILNGMNYSENPQTNVKVEGLNAQPYKVKIIFNDTSLGVINDKIYMDFAKEKTYAVRLRKIGEGEKTAKKISQNLFSAKPAEQTEEKIDEINSTNEKYVLRTISVTNLQVSAQAQQYSNQQTPAPQQNTQQRTVNTQANSGTTQQQTQTTTTVVATNPAPVKTNANVSMNINLNGGATYHESTTTTTTFGSAGTQQSNVYVMPGYGGPVGCPWPMSNEDFQSAKSSIAAKSFEDSKLTLAKQIMNTNCLFSSQVKEIMLIFSFEGTRLDLAKYGYGYTFDIGNYYKVNDAFTFESSIDELNSYINAR
ncbi:MAG: DUF4476 domain-containing protein [Bacteroidota bacterium]|nr:DUF4476 domain-containing protein [Bacteroidota bacterium]